jgi:hypothetical protein
MEMLWAAKLAITPCMGVITPDPASITGGMKERLDRIALTTVG